MVKVYYDYIIIDCAPSLGLLTINALAAADEVIIPVMPRFLDVMGLESLLYTIARVKRNINT
jgi:chromosome partitioning protein